MDGSIVKLEGSVRNSEELVQTLVRALMHDLPAASGAEQAQLYELQVRLVSPVGQGRQGYRGQLQLVRRGDHILFGRASLDDGAGSPVALATATFRAET